MRIPEGVQRRRRRRRRPAIRRGRGFLVTIVAVLLVLVVSARALARVYTDYLWFDSLGVASVWEHRIGYQVMLGVVFSLAFFALMAGNLLIANRISPPIVPRRTGDELVERYRELVGARQRTVFLSVSAVLAILAGAGASSQWRNLVLFRFGDDFGRTDPLHRVDLGFYVFKLPFLDYVLSWSFAALVFVVLLVVVAHYLNGSLHLPGTGAVAGPKVKAQLSILFALLALVKATDFWLDRYRLTLSDRGTVQGALYTDVTATMPAKLLLVLIGVLCAVTFLVNIRRRGWGLPLTALGLWVLMALIAGTVYPAVVQQLRVESAESKRETEYLRYNIAATRAAFGLDRVEERNFDYEERLTDQAITDNASTISNVRLLDPDVLPPTFTSLQSKLDYYAFTDLDVDRYEIGGQETEVIIGARELDPDKVPGKTWENRHLTYTHGYGVAMAPANAVNANGEPDFAVDDVPVRVDQQLLPDLTLERPEIYFGEKIDGVDGDGYAIVGTRLRERGQSADETTRYDGGGGVAVDSFLRRAAFALRFGDLQPVTSEYLTSESRVLFQRNVRERVEQIAPFLQWDHDPYPVVVDGGIKYVIDGYTVSDSVPYSQPATDVRLDEGSGLAGLDFNYVRNSVKGVVDAYDGSVTLYLTDTLYGAADPVIAAYNAAFGELFTPAAEMPEELQSHLRYPEDLFRVQTTMWGRYHLDDPGAFYNRQDAWDVAQRPPESFGDPSSPTSVPEPVPTSSTPAAISPNYLQMRLPDEAQDEFVLFRPFVPHSENSTRKQLNAFMVGRSDPADYGTLAVYTMTEQGADGRTQRNRNVDGPLNAHDAMVSDTETRLSERLTQLNGQRGGSSVTLGNMVIVPVEQSLLYVRPIYVSGEDTVSSRQLRIVVVSIGGEVAIGDTLAQALGNLFPDASITTREGGGSTPTTPTSPTTEQPTTEQPTTPPGTEDGATAAELVERAVQLFDEADEALRSGSATSLGDYQAKTAEAEALVRQAREMLLDAAGEGAEPGA